MAQVTSWSELIHSPSPFWSCSCHPASRKQCLRHGRSTHAVRRWPLAVASGHLDELVASAWAYTNVACRQRTRQPARQVGQWAWIFWRGVCHCDFLFLCAACNSIVVLYTFQSGNEQLVSLLASAVDALSRWPTPFASMVCTLFGKTSRSAC